MQFLSQLYVFVTFRFLFVLGGFYTLFHRRGGVARQGEEYFLRLQGGVPPTPTYDLDASRTLLDLRENGQFQPPLSFRRLIRFCKTRSDKWMWETREGKKKKFANPLIAARPFHISTRG